MKLLRFMHYNYNVPLKESLLYGINPEKEELDFDIISTNKHYIELFFNVILSQAGSDQFGRFRPKDVTPSKLLDYFLSQELAFDENQKLPNTLKDINVLLRKKLAYQDIDFFDEVKLGHALTPNEMSKVLKKI